MTCVKFGIFYLLFLIIAWPLSGQDKLSQLFADSASSLRQPVMATFKSDFIVNAQSNETLHKHELILNVTHRFDDIAGDLGGVKTFFGLDNSTDIKIALEYGITDRLTVGFARAKGAPEVRDIAVAFNSLRELWEGKLKYRLWQQTTDDHVPIAVTLFANAVVSSQAAVDDPTSDIYFQQFSDRWSFVGQVIVARKFSDRFSLALLPTYVKRTRVAYGDLNNLFGLGAGFRLKISKTMAIILDYFVPFRGTESRDYFKQQGIDFYNPLAIGWEIQTGGHVFHINFTNSTAILENQFIPYTTRTWTKGELRWGFSISRTFILGKRK